MCTTLESDDGELDSKTKAIVAGGSFGALAAFLLILLTAVAAFVCIKKGVCYNYYYY